MTSLRAERARADAERRRGLVRIGIAVAVVVAAVVALIVLAGGRPVPPARATYDAGTTDPVAAAVPVLSGFAEATRGLRFRTRPQVQAVDAATFARVVAEPIPTTDGGPAGNRTATTRALALGHLRAPADALPEAYYSYRRHTVFLRQGRPFDAFARVVLVHELTHALQDQSFGLLPLARAAAGDADRARALAAVVEGDATQVELAYLASQPAADQAAVRARYDYDPKPRSYAELDRTFPYTVGRDFVTTLAAQGGNAAVDTAFRHPPVSTAQVIDPRDYTGGVEPLGVRAPPAEGQRLDGGTLGQFGLAALVTRGLRVANVSAASGWLGDAYVTYRVSGRLCTSANVVVSDSEQRDQLLRDLAAWVSSRGGKAMADRSGERGVRLRSCA